MKSIVTNQVFSIPKKKITLFSLCLFVSSIIAPPSAHAYAGPGVAIGAMIVAITVFFAFIASTFIGLLGFIRKIFKRNSVKNKKANNNNNNNI